MGEGEPGVLKRPLSLGSPFGLRTTISSAGIASYLIAVPPLAWLAAKLLSLNLTSALAAGALSSVLMFLSDWLHQLGHARAARRTGYPMVGIHFTSPFSISVYPRDEPSLSPAVHMRRALGGFWVNLLIGLLLAPAAIYLWPRGGLVAWLTAFTSAFNFFVIGLGSLLPIDIPGVFTVDGGTLLRLWRNREK